MGFFDHIEDFKIVGGIPVPIQKKHDEPEQAVDHPERIAERQYLRNVMSHVVAHHVNDVLPADSLDRYACAKCGLTGLALLDQPCSEMRRS